MYLKIKAVVIQLTKDLKYNSFELRDDEKLKVKYVLIIVVEEKINWVVLMARDDG